MSTECWLTPSSKGEGEMMQLDSPPTADFVPITRRQQQAWAPGDLSELEHLAMLPAEMALRHASALLHHLLKDRVFLEAHLPLLQTPVEAAGPFVARRYGGREGSASLEVFVWPAGAATQIHDHACWGAFRCAIGSLLEDRYARRDDGSLAHHAHLWRIWQRVWTGAAGASTLLPYAGGIHRVANPSASVALSVHLYGPRMGALDGQDYDPARNYVCGRFDSAIPA
jgi:Cysteine dioxygenase type I